MVSFIFAAINFRVVVCKLTPLASSYDIILGRDWISDSMKSTDWGLKDQFSNVVPFHLNSYMTSGIMLMS